jgi:hypothetical protein
MRTPPVLLLAAMLLAASPAHRAIGHAQQGGAATATRPPQSLDERVAGMKKLDGFFPLYWDERTGSIFLEIPRFDTDFLF